MILGLALATVVSGCGPSAEELAAQEAAEAAAEAARKEGALKPLDDAFDELRQFQFEVEAGMTNDDILEKWPSISASVRSKIEDLDSERLKEVFSPEELPDVLAYADAIAAAHDEFAEMVKWVRSYVRYDTSRRPIRTNFEGAKGFLEEATSVRETILPGATS